MATDPVCAMRVDESKAKYVSMHEGKKFFFCSVNCKSAFDKNPLAYAKK